MRNTFTIGFIATALLLTACNEKTSELPQAGVEAKVLGVHAERATLETKEDVVFLDVSGGDLRKQLHVGDKVRLIPNKNDNGYDEIGLKDGTYIHLN